MPTDRRNRLLKNIILPAVFTALIVAGAFFRVPLFAVPYSLQFTFVTLTVMLLKSPRAALSVGAYIALGLIGIPVFAGGGGIGYLLKPTFGYIAGFFVGALLSGLVLRRRRSFPLLLAAGFLNLVIVYGVGSLWFLVISATVFQTAYGVGALLSACVLPFVPSDSVFIVLCALLASKLGKQLSFFN